MPSSHDPAHASWLSVSWEIDAAQVIELLTGHPMDWIVVDHYALDSRWESRVQPMVNHLLVIDDLADRQHVCDALLDQNLLPSMESRYAGLVPDTCQCWLGPQFLLLRERFAWLAASVGERSGPVKRALIAFAGADTANLTSIAIEAVTGSLPVGLSVDVLISAQHPARDEVRAACALAGFTLHEQIEDVGALMASTDLAIAACGFVSYELVAMRVPSILFPLSEIQAEVAMELAEHGAAMVLSSGMNGFGKNLRQAFLTMLANDKLRSTMSDACHSIVDGQGAARVAARMLQFA
jgi:UDP-2,4-diacetamido-2,4,6-trideoxy-beta-L-altropyranose hydrolase